MIYFFVDKDGTEGCANEHPTRNYGKWFTWKGITILPKGTIEKVISKKLTWENEPYEYYG